MSTPLYDATLSDFLQRARADAAAKAAADVAGELAALRQELQAVRDARLALVVPLVAPEPPTPEVEPEDEPVAPAVPSFDELRIPRAKASAFFDSLLGS